MSCESTHHDHVADDQLSDAQSGWHAGLEDRDRGACGEAYACHTGRNRSVRARRNPQWAAYARFALHDQQLDLQKTCLAQGIICVKQHSAAAAVCTCTGLTLGRRAGNRGAGNERDAAHNSLWSPWLRQGCSSGHSRSLGCSHHRRSWCCTPRTGSPGGRRPPGTLRRVMSSFSAVGCMLG